MNKGGNVAARSCCFGLPEKKPKAPALKAPPVPAGAGVAATPLALSAKIDEIGFGPSQLLSLLCCGGIMFSEGSEVLVMGSITKLLAAEWHLGALEKGAMVAIVFIGFAIGNLISGELGDGFGRRRSILTAYIVIGVAGLLTSLTNNVAEMLCVRIFVGIGCGIGFPSVYSLTPEVCPTYIRGPLSSLMIGFMPLGEMYAALGVMMIDHNLSGGGDALGEATWRTLIQYSALPSLVFFVVSYYFLHESPHYLLSQGRVDELNERLGEMARMNGKKGLVINFEAPYNDDRESATHIVLNLVHKYSWSDAVRYAFSSRYWRTTIVLFLAHFTKDFSVFGLSYVFPQYFIEMSGSTSVGLSMMLVSLLALPGVFIAVGITRTEMLGHIASLSIVSASCAVAAVGLLDQFDVVTCSYCVKFLAMCYFIVVVVYTAEVFPTSMRNTCVGLCTSAGRLGSISAPIVFEMTKRKTSSFDPFWTILIVLMMAIAFSGMCFLNIETKGVALRDSEVDSKRRVTYASTSSA